MATFLLLNDIKTTAAGLSTGELLNDEIFDVDELNRAGGLTIPFTPGMVIFRDRFVALRSGDSTIDPSSLMLSLLIQGLVQLVDVLSQHEFIEVESDFPDPVAGVITLEENKVYNINGSVAITNRLVMPVTVILRGVSASRDKLIFTGTGAMITVQPGSGLPTISGLNLTHTTGLALDVNGPANFVLRQIVITANEIAQIDVSGGIVMDSCLFTGFSSGVTFEGTPDRLTSGTTAYIQATGGGNACVDFGTSVFDSVLMGGLRCITASGGFGVSGLTSSANISTGNFGKISISDFNGSGTALSGITNADIRWEFTSTGGVEDTIDLADVDLPPGNTTVTTISTQGSAGDALGWVKLAGTTTATFESRLTMSADNRIRYDGEFSKKLEVEACLSIEMDGGGSNDLQMGIAINGTIDTATATPVSASSASPSSVSCVFVSTFAPGDFVEVFVRNVSSMNNILGLSLHFIVKSL